MMLGWCYLCEIMKLDKRNFKCKVVKIEIRVWEIEIRFDWIFLKGS